MKRYIILGFISIISMLLQAQETIAIYVVGDADNNYKKVIATALTKTVNDDGTYAAVERTDDFLAALGSETGYQNSGAVSSQEITKLGKQFGAQFLFAVDVSKILGEIYAASRIINVETGLVVATNDANAQISNLSQLRSFAEGIAESTIAKIPQNIAKKQEQENARQQEEARQQAAAQAQQRAAEEARQREIARQNELAQKRNILNKFTPKSIYTASDLYNMFNAIAGEYDIENIRQLCQELGEPFQSPAIYSFKVDELNSDSKSTTYMILAKFKNSNGSTESKIVEVKVNKNGAIISSEPIRGYVYIIR